MKAPSFHLHPRLRMQAAAWRALLTAVGLLLALLPTLALAATGARPEQEPVDAAGDWARVQKAGKLVLGTAADYQPFEFYNSNYELDGFDIALAKALGEELGIEVEFNDYAFDGLLDQVQLRQVDAALAAISVTPDRRERVDFSSLYYVGNSAVVAGSGFTQTITSAHDMAGLFVGVQRGSTHQAWAQQNLVDTGLIPQENLATYPSVRNMFTDLRTGKLDVGLMGNLTADLAVKGRGLALVGEGLNPQQFAIALPKGSSLLGPLNEALLAIESDGRFAALSQRYLAETPTQTSPSAGGAVVVVLPTATPPAAQTPATPTPVQPVCLNSMQWVADLNLDDQNMKAPAVLVQGQDFVKGWRVRNNGNCAWPADTALAYASGNRIEAAMGGSSVAVGREVAPGEEIDLKVSLRAPQTFGTFQGFWKMRDPLGMSFGETIWAGIQVPDPNPPPTPTPLPQPTAAPQPQQPQQPAVMGPNLRADSAYISAGQCTAVRWEVDNVNSVYFIDGGNQQGVGGHDARSVCPTATTTYVLRVLGTDGQTHDFPITVNVSGTAGYSINFWVDNGNIDAGQCTHLHWDVRNVQAVYLNNEGVAGVSDREVCPGNTQTYNLNVVKGDVGQEGRQVTINVNNARPQRSQPRVNRFDVDRNMVFVGDCVTVEWRTDDADGVNIFRNGDTLQQGGSGNGSYEDCSGPVGVNEYRISAYNGAGQETRDLSVVVQDASD